MTQSLALSSSTQNSEKTESSWLQFPPRSYHSSLLTVQWHQTDKIHNLHQVCGVPGCVIMLAT